MVPHASSKTSANSIARIGILLLVGFGLLGSDSLLGQVAPGGRTVGADRNRAEFLSAVMTEVGFTMHDWREAWRNDDVESAVELYTENAVLRPPHSAPLRGRDIVEEYLRSALPLTGNLRMADVDVDASGDIAWFLGTWQHELATTDQWSGGYAMLARLEGRTWRIRSQVFFAPPGQEEPGLPAIQGQGSEFGGVDVGAGAGTAWGTLARLSGAFEARDVERAVALLDEEARLQLFDGSRTNGRGEAGVALADLFTDGGGRDLRMAVADYDSSDRLGHAFGHYSVRDSDDPAAPLRGGPFVALLRQRGSDWLIRALVFIRE